VLTKLKASGETTLLKHSLIEELNLEIVAALGEYRYRYRFRY
jgi:hypothetical protein